jgi:hypothetical protein
VPNALQCPACGHKHRLSSLTGEPMFTCTQCGRLLKVPTEFRRPEPSTPGEPPRPGPTPRVERGGSARRDQTSVLPAPASRPTAGAARPRPKGRPSTDMALPLRILAWVVAVGLGAYIVRWFARITGWLTGDSLIDLITGSGILRYLRIFTLVPFWALVTAGLATLFIEGGRWLARRRDLAAGRAPAARAARPPAKRPARTRQVPPASARVPSEPAAVAPPPVRPVPKPVPKPVAPKAAPKPAAAEPRSPSSATAAPKPRRIPRRDVTP